MARIPRALLLIVLLLTACRFSPERRQAIVRFAVSTILSVASTAQASQPSSQPVQVTARCPHARVARAVPAPAVAKPAVEVVAAIPVHTMNIATAALRPAADECEIVRSARRFEVARLRIDRLQRQFESVQKARCREAELNPVTVIEEIRALPEEGNVCLADPDEVSVPVLDMRVHRAIGG